MGFAGGVKLVCEGEPKVSERNYDGRPEDYGCECATAFNPEESGSEDAGENTKRLSTVGCSKGPERFSGASANMCCRLVGGRQPLSHGVSRKWDFPCVDWPRRWGIGVYRRVKVREDQESHGRGRVQWKGGEERCWGAKSEAWAWPTQLCPHGKTRSATLSKARAQRIQGWDAGMKPVSCLVRVCGEAVLRTGSIGDGSLILWIVSGQAMRGRRHFPANRRGNEGVAA